MTNPEEEDIFEVKKLTLVEVGVIVSIALSIGTGIFTVGVIYGEVRENTRHRELASEQQAEMREDIAEMKANVNFLVQLAQEQRSRP